MRVSYCRPTKKALPLFGCTGGVAAVAPVAERAAIGRGPAACALQPAAARAVKFTVAMLAEGGVLALGGVFEAL